MPKSPELLQSTASPSTHGGDQVSCPPAYEEAVHLTSATDHTADTTASSVQLQQYDDDNNNLSNDEESTQPLLQVTIDDNSRRPETSSHQYPIRPIPYRIKNDSIVSDDRHINEDGERLEEFLLEHNTPPKLKIRIRGYHSATRYKSRVTSDRDGNMVVEESDPQTTQVEDFNYEVDCSKYISSVCQGLHGTRDVRSDYAKTAREMCEEYVQKQNRLKELTLTKKVKWNYSELTQALTAAIRSNGYQHNLAISYELKESKITIRTGLSRLTFLAENCRTAITSEWVMTICESNFYHKHVTEIIENTSGKRSRVTKTPSTQQ
ncbi:hypothetical protein DFQ28_000457 [Apophysomyces sp. BC1034]|nr:hypothetical protein DFQ28_000457 [Apophysomyces sp. BC1034]